MYGPILVSNQAAAGAKLAGIKPHEMDEEGREVVSAEAGGLHPSTFQLNLICFCHRQTDTNQPAYPAKSVYVELKKWKSVNPLVGGDAGEAVEAHLRREAGRA